MREFGKQFEHFIEINFEKNKAVHHYFSSDLDINTLLQKLSIYAKVKIEASTTLLFFDEVQACEGALQSLRYFKEDRPDIHIIAAGSLLDFALNKYGIAVGRFQFLQLYPLSFSEYLSVIGKAELRHFLFAQQHDQVLHQQLIEHMKNYMWLGGMPAVIDAWVTEEDSVLCQRQQDEIIESYQIDFHRYAKQHEIPFVTRVFERIPAMLGNKFIYSHVEQDVRTEKIKNALLLLELAGIAKRCFHTAAQSAPLSAEQDDKKFKVYYFDLGIAQRLLGLDIRQWTLNPFQLSTQGAIAEQFVAQELIAYSDSHKTARLYYWHRENKSSNAEVDFVLMKHGEIIPVEVKSSKKGSMKSMQLFLDSHKNAHYGLKISAGTFSKQPHLQEIPLYALEGWMRAPLQKN